MVDNGSNLAANGAPQGSYQYFPLFLFLFSLLVVLSHKIFKLNIGTTDWESYLTFVDNVHSYGKGFIWGDGYEKSRSERMSEAWGTKKWRGEVGNKQEGEGDKNRLLI